MRNRPPIRPALIVACIVAAIIAVVAIRSCVGGAARSTVGEVGTAVSVAERTVQVEGSRSRGSYELNPSDMLTIPDSADVTTFSLGSTPAAEIPAASLAEVNAAIADVEEVEDGCSCGFVFIDVDSGHGLAYNAGKTMYVASAAKAPFIYYILSNDAISLDEDERESVEYVIIDSDNASFEDLAFRYIDDGYASWLSGLGVYHDDYYFDFYPPMSARSLTAVWAEILQYLRDGSEDAQWLAGLMGSTEVSFIRDGLAGAGATVMNKGGWIVEEGYESVTDAAIVEAGGRTYLMVIVTDQPDGGLGESNVSSLAGALFDLRGRL